MPVYIRKSPFSPPAPPPPTPGGKRPQKPPRPQPGPSATPPIRTPQARVLAALVPDDVSVPVFDWPLVTRAQLGVRAGYTAISGTVTRALNGIRPGSSSGDPHLGLMDLGCIEEVVLDIEGTKEVNYRITKRGIAALLTYMKEYGATLPVVRDASVCTNERYKREQIEPTKDSLHPEGL